MLRRATGLADAGFLRLRNSPLDIRGVEHDAYRLTKAKRPVFNRSGRVHRRDGRVVGFSGRLTLPPLAAAAASRPALLSSEQAIAFAERAAPGRGARRSPSAELGWFADTSRHQTVPAWLVRIARAQPLGSWLVTLDARDGRLLSREDLLRTITGSGHVYGENVVSSGSPSSQPLFDLDASGFLKGRIAQVFDIRDAEAFRPDAVFSFAEADPRFVQTSAYRGLTNAARFAEAHGFPPFTRSLLAFTNLRGNGGGEEEFNNAYYDPFFPLFAFGNGDGTITSNLGTDLDVAAHEMGHHIFQVLVDPQGSGGLGGLGSINEGFADTLAALLSNDPEIGESTIPGQPFLRNVDNSASWPADASSSAHSESRIYSGFNWEMKEALGTATAADILIAALPYLDPQADFASDEYRRAILAGESDVSGGVNRTALEAIADARGLEDLASEGISGFLEEGVSESGVLSDGQLDIYFFSEFPGSTELRFETFGGGDADLIVAPLVTADDPSTYAESLNAFTSSEFIRINLTTDPNVNEDDVWIVGVADFEDQSPSSYTLSVSTDPPFPTVAIGGPPVTGTITEGGGLELHAFSGSANQIVGVEVTALAANLDLAVSVFEITATVVLGADDDSGPGSDPLLQGVRLPATNAYGLAVFSLTADVDPRVGTGDYELRLTSCSNFGPDSDGDSQVDACDDDDDNDGFVDAIDSEPHDPLRCQDVEGDGCDDCVSGSFDPFHDGANADGDHLCDSGDPDDDNDGCADTEDGAPFTTSVDDDVDSIGDDCDNCPDDYNPDQLDSDQDGLGDLCDPTPIPAPSATASALAALSTVLAAARIRRAAAVARKLASDAHQAS